MRTPWILQGDDLGALLLDRLGPLLKPGDIAVVSEKAVVIAERLGIPADIQVSPLARRLAAWVRPRDDSRGLSLPAKMESVIRRAGRPRVLLATAAAGLTRPLGLHGAFYVVAGRVARAMDGMRPPFENLLLPPLAPRHAIRIARSLSQRLGTPVVIADMNDRGGSIRARSHTMLSKRRLRRILADNPLGQRDTRTPIAVVRPLKS